MSKTYTQEELDTMAELGMLANTILNMPMPNDVKKSATITAAKIHAASHLRDMGYSIRQIATALHLKSPRSVQYLLEKSTAASVNQPNKQVKE